MIKKAIKRKVNAKKRKLKKKAAMAVFGKCYRCQQPKKPFHRCKRKFSRAAAARTARGK